MKRKPEMRMCWLLAVLCVGLYFPGQFKILAETEEQRDQRMAWWREARFGMFIHWGLYAVPAGEWKGKKIPGIGEWIMHRARIPVPDYETLVPQFNPVKFNAKQWARIAKQAGMKYMVITSKHHDGFCLWDSKLTDYDIMATPFKRDLLKELADACKEEGIRFCFYHSIMDWHHPDQNKDFPSYEKYLYGQVRELLTGYGPLGVLWFDGEWIKQWNREKGRELAKFIWGIQPNIVINNRVGKRHPDDGDFGTPEQTIPATGIPGHDWETCMTMNNTWGFKKDDHNWKSVDDLLRKLVDIASKGGNFLLNVGPTAEGLIPQPSVERLAAMGKWLEVNGESVHGTMASPFKKLPWGRCTQKPGKLYLHVFNWPQGSLAVPGLTNKVKAAYLLCDRERKPLSFKRQDHQLVISLPAEAPDKIDTVVVLEIEGDAEVVVPLLQQAANGSIQLTAREAKLHGATLQYESGGGKDNIGYWTKLRDWVSWDFRVRQPGAFLVELTLACEPGSEGSEYVVQVGSSTLKGKVAPTGSWTQFATQKLGEVKLKEAGKLTLSVKAETNPKYAVMNLKSVSLKPVK